MAAKTTDLEKRKQEMIVLRKEGMSLQNIAGIYGISRERVRQVLGNVIGHAHQGFETHEDYRRYAKVVAGLFESGMTGTEVTKLTGTAYAVARKLAIAGGYVFRKLNDDLLEDGLRRCSRCGGVKRISEYGVYRGTKSGFSRVCKVCNRANSIAQYHKRKARNAN